MLLQETSRPPERNEHQRNKVVDNVRRILVNDHRSNDHQGVADSREVADSRGPTQVSAREDLVNGHKETPVDARTRAVAVVDDHKAVVVAVDARTRAVAVDDHRVVVAVDADRKAADADRKAADAGRKAADARRKAAGAGHKVAMCPALR
jgi:hypothetical protein